MWTSTVEYLFRAQKVTAAVLIDMFSVDCVLAGSVFFFFYVVGNLSMEWIRSLLEVLHTSAALSDVLGIIDNGWMGEIGGR